MRGGDGPPPAPPLARRRDGPIAGVCAGIAAWFGWGSRELRRLRIAWLVLAVLTLLPSANYVALWAYLPLEGEEGEDGDPSRPGRGGG